MIHLPSTIHIPVCVYICMGVSKIGGKPPKMDGENHGSKPYEQMDDLGGFPIIFWFNTHIDTTLPETNIDPENGWLEDYFPFGKAYFQGRTVSSQEGRYLYKTSSNIGSLRPSLP